MKNIMKFPHNLFQTWKTAFSLGHIVPIGLIEVLPGDVLRGGTDFFCHVAPLNATPFSKLEICIESHYVPDRLVWEDAEDYHTGEAIGGTPPVYPTINLYSRYGSGVPAGSLADWFGIPTGGTNGTRTVSALPFRKFQLIRNHRYRGHELDDVKVISTASGTDTTTELDLSVCHWRDDYFTKASSSQQRANSILLEVERLSNATRWKAYKDGTNTLGASDDLWVDPNGDITDAAGTDKFSFDPVGGLVLDAKDIRDGLKMQRYFERDQRRNSNQYSDMIADLFGVSKQDMRLADPVTMSSTKERINFTDVTQTGVDSTGEGLGQYTGRGVGSVKGRGYKYFVPEHGHVITTCYIRPARSAYMDGIQKLWLKTLREHHYQPELAHMSFQAILNREVKADHTTPSGTFAWNPIYQEYRESLDVTAGSMRSTYDYYHTDRSFDANVAFNSSFLECIPDTRLFQAPTDDQFIAIAYNSLKAKRVVVPEGTPL